MCFFSAYPELEILRLTTIQNKPLQLHGGLALDRGIRGADTAGFGAGRQVSECASAGPRMAGGRAKWSHSSQAVPPTRACSPTAHMGHAPWHVGSVPRLLVGSSCPGGRSWVVSLFIPFSISFIFRNQGIFTSFYQLFLYEASRLHK